MGGYGAGCLFPKHYNSPYLPYSVEKTLAAMGLTYQGQEGKAARATKHGKKKVGFSGNPGNASSSHDKGMLAVMAADNQPN
jgi:hypothetical protein